MAHARKLAVKYGDKVKPRSYPIPTSKAARDRFEALEPAPEGECFDIALYLSAMGDIGWPTVMTFPQLCYYHSYLGQFMMSPSAEAYEYLLHIIGTSLEMRRLAFHLGEPYKFLWGSPRCRPTSKSRMGRLRTPTHRGTKSPSHTAAT